MERTGQLFHTNPVEPTRAMSATFERLALRHGSVKVDLYWLEGQPYAYVRTPGAARYNVGPSGAEHELPDNDRRPYYDDEED